MEENIFQKAYNWAISYKFTDIEINYAAKLVLKMLDDSCNMNHHDRKIFFFVYDAIVDREDIQLEDEINQLIKLARNRDTIFSKPEFSPIIHACRIEVIPSMQKKYMKRYKKMVRTNLGLIQKDEEI